VNLELAEELCRRFEGFRSRPYLCPAGVPTIGYGAGPRSFLDANGHRADERLVLADLRVATEVVALAVAEVLLSGAAFKA